MLAIKTRSVELTRCTITPEFIVIIFDTNRTMETQMLPIPTLCDFILAPYAVKSGGTDAVLVVDMLLLLLGREKESDVLTIFGFFQPFLTSPTIFAKKAAF
jgi:hypothetical protein